MTNLQASGKSKRESWRTELPKAGLGGMVIEKMKDEKQNDAAWQGKCSGTVYVFSCETGIHFGTHKIPRSAEVSSFKLLS